MKMKLCRNQYLALLVLITVAPALLATAQPVAPRALPTTTETKLRDLLADPVVQQAHIGLSIMALGTADNPQAFPARQYAAQERPTLFEVDGEKRFMPASNVKLYTAALALYKMGPEMVFTTSLATDAPLYGADFQNGVLQGNLYLLGDGDPSLSTSDIKELARGLAAHGIKTVKGHVIAVADNIRGETFGNRYPDGWTLDDTIWYYGPEISSLAFNRNQVDVTITGAEQAGKNATVQVEPLLEGLHIQSSVKTSVPESQNPPSLDGLSFNRIDKEFVPGQQNALITITGRIAPGEKRAEGLAIPNPPLLAALALKQELAVSGVAVEGMFSRLNLREHKVTYTKGVEGGVMVGQWPEQRALLNENVLVRHNSPPLRVLLRRLLKNSDNLYAEMLLRNVALRSFGYRPVAPQSEQAHKLLFTWLHANSVPTQGLRFTDGSGLSRYNMITPRATAQLLAAVDRMSNGDAFWEAMPIAGVDGTLKNRMRSTPAANNARAKTGTFSIVSTLSGYVTTRDGHRLAVSLLTNFTPDGTAVRAWQDKVYVLLAEADWSTPAAN